MNIRIERYHSSPPSIDGQLYVNDLPYCDCAENVENSLPEGTYPLRLLRCKQYGRQMLLTTPNPNCKACLKHRIGSQLGALPQVCPMLKAGNGVHRHRDGGIILGVRIQSGIVLHSGKYFERLYERIRKAVKRGEQITLTIKNIINK